MTTKKQITAHKLANTDQAVIDLRLTDLEFRLLALMVKLSDGETGIVRRRQAELAKLLGRTRRSVQRCLDRLIEFKYLDPIGQARKGIVRAYNVLKAKDATPESHVVPAQPEMRHQSRLDATPVSPRCDPSFAHTSLSTPLKNLPCAGRETGADGPRGLEGLGPSPDQEGKRLTNGHALIPEATPPPPPALDDQFGPLDVDKLKRKVGADQFKGWLADLRFVDLADGILTLAARTKFDAREIANRFERQLLESAPGAWRLDVVVAS